MRKPTTLQRLRDIKDGTGVYAPKARYRDNRGEELRLIKDELRSASERLDRARAKISAACDMADAFAKLGEMNEHYAEWAALVARLLRKAVGHRPRGMTAAQETES